MIGDDDLIPLNTALKSTNRPYKFMPKYELSNKELTELFKLIEMRVGTDEYNKMSIMLKKHFDRD